jgi:hypothetical protein
MQCSTGTAVIILFEIHSVSNMVAGHLARKLENRDILK